MFLISQVRNEVHFLVVFLTFWQATLLSGFSLLGVVKDVSQVTQRLDLT